MNDKQTNLEKARQHYADRKKNRPKQVWDKVGRCWVKEYANG